MKEVKEAVQVGTSLVLRLKTEGTVIAANSL